MFFFNSWTTASHVQTFAACIVLLLLAISHELVRSASKLRSNQPTNQAQQNIGDVVPPAKDGDDDKQNKVWYRRYVSPSAVIDVALSAAQVVIFYLLIMAVMTMNVWVFLTIVCGAVIGRFIPLSRLLPRPRVPAEASPANDEGVTKTA